MIVNQKRFVHLKVRSHYSILEGSMKVADIVESAKKMIDVISTYNVEYVKFQSFIAEELCLKNAIKNNPLKTINNQINQIENLVNEFSDFARMPKPVYKNNNLKDVIKSNIELLRKLDNEIKFNFNSSNSINFNFDYEQISRVCFNLIKNSIESIREKHQKTPNSIKNINIEIVDHIDYISLTIIDTGIGFKNIKTSELTKPYFTTKSDGTGLGLSIVSKIINDHNGVISFLDTKDGAKIEIKFYK